MPESLAAKPMRCLFRAFKVEGQEARQHLVLTDVGRSATGQGDPLVDFRGAHGVEIIRHQNRPCHKAEPFDLAGERHVERHRQCGIRVDHGRLRGLR